MKKTIKFLVKKINNGQRVDIYLANMIGDFTRSQIKRLINEKNLKINEKLIVSASSKIKTNDELVLQLVPKKRDELTPTKLKLDIIFEDKDLLVINKPKGLVVHPGAGNFSNTLANALAYKYKNNLSDINGKLRPGIVHRIDKQTSGLLVIAKNNKSHSDLAKQFNNHSIKRTYICLVWGVIRPLNGKIETLISRNKKNRQLMAVSDFRGKRAVTNYKTLKVFNYKDIPKISLIECNLETGRTHQIRVHLNYRGTSILGDNQYGKKGKKFKKINKNFYQALDKLNGQALHAKTLGFVHPTKKKAVIFNSKLPTDFKKMLDLLSNLSS